MRGTLLPWTMAVCVAALNLTGFGTSLQAVAARLMVAAYLFARRRARSIQLIRPSP